MALRVINIINFMYPRIYLICLWMVVQFKDLDFAIPYSFPFKQFFYRHSLNMAGIDTM